MRSCEKSEEGSRSVLNIPARARLNRNSIHRLRRSWPEPCDFVGSRLVLAVPTDDGLGTTEMDDASVAPLRSASHGDSVRDLRVSIALRSSVRAFASSQSSRQPTLSFVFQSRDSASRTREVRALTPIATGFAGWFAVEVCLSWVLRQLGNRHRLRRLVEHGHKAGFLKGVGNRQTVQIHEGREEILPLKQRRRSLAGVRGF